MMGWYRRGKLALGGFQSLASSVAAQNPNFQCGSRIAQSGCFNSCSKGSNIKGFSSFSSISYRLGARCGGVNRSLHNPFVAGGRRYYYVDPYNVQHFRRRGPRGWFQIPRQLFIVVVGGSGILITLHFGNLETVPYTKRTDWILLSKSMKRQLGEAEFEKKMARFKGKILPPTHHQSVRMRMIAKDIIDALQRGLREEQAWSDVGYASEHVTVFEGDRRDSLGALAGGDGKVEGGWHRADEILDERWVQQSMKGGSQPATSHLDGLNWEVLVVNAFCLPGGKRVAFTGLLEHFRSDAEIATIIGHEVGHAVARHRAEGMKKTLWLVILQLILYQFVAPDIVNTISSLFLLLPLFSRRMEMEADYIGLLLIASAGYDPRVATLLYEKLGKVTGDSALRNYLFTHPFGRKRAELLAQAKVMEDALTIYRDVKSGRGIEGFL